MTKPLVAIIAFDQFSLFHLSVPCLIFGDILPHTSLFDLKLCQGDPGVLTSGQGLYLQHAESLTILAKADIIIVPYWRNPDEKPKTAVLEALTEAHRRGAWIVGLCLGTYVLAYAGILDHLRAATHWAFEEDFRVRFPYIQLDQNALYVDNQRLITSAGTAAGIDCCLYLVRQFYGTQIANKIARRMVIAPHREGGQAQFIERPIPQSTQDIHFNALLNDIRNNLHLNHSLDDLAQRVHMSRRTFTRQFHKATGMSMTEWLILARLHAAQELLECSTLSMEQIAEMTGFQTTVSLRFHFKKQFKIPPSEWRKSFRGNT